jgi:thiamine-phosphate diphosphorylase
MARLAHPAIVLVTSGAATGEREEGWRAAIASASQAAAAGIDVVQIREPRLTDRSLGALVRCALRETQGSRTAVVVNDRPDIARCCGAAGVHLRADGMSAARVRGLLPGEFLVGRSVHSFAEAGEAASDRAVDYLLFGTVFESPSKSSGHVVQGPAALESICQRVTIPVIAIGGITVANVRKVAAAGAAGVAAISLFADAERTYPGGLSAVVRDLRGAFV